MSRYDCPMTLCGWYMTAHELASHDDRAGVTRGYIASAISDHLLAAHVRQQATMTSTSPLYGPTTHEDTAVRPVRSDDDTKVAETT